MLFALAVLLLFGLLTLWIPARWPLSLFQAGAFTLALPYAWRIARSSSPFLAGFPMAPLCGAVLWAALQLGLRSTVYRQATFEALLYWAAALALYFTARQLLDSPRLRRRFLRLLVWFAFALSVLASLQYFSSQGKVLWLFPLANAPPLATFPYKNDYAAFLELLLPVALFEALADRRHTLRFTVIAGSLCASVILSASRAGALLLALEIVLVLLLSLLRRDLPGSSLRRVLSRAAVFAAIFTAVVGWQILLGRFQQSDPYLGRRELLASSLAMLGDRPILGHGLGAWPDAYPAYALFDAGAYANHAHNDWAEWAAEGGIPFLLLLLSLALWTLRPAIRSLWGLGVPVFFLHCWVDYPTRRLPVAAVLFVLIAALAASSRAQPHSTPSMDSGETR